MKISFSSLRGNGRILGKTEKEDDSCVFTEGEMKRIGC